MSDRRDFFDAWAFNAQICGDREVIKLTSDEAGGMLEDEVARARAEEREAVVSEVIEWKRTVRGTSLADELLVSDVIDLIRARGKEDS